jgi:hypothetical protein
MGACHLDDLEALVVEEVVGKDHQDNHPHEGNGWGNNLCGTATSMVFPHTTTPKENLDIGSN